MLFLDTNVLKQLAKDFTPPILLKASRDMLAKTRGGYYTGPYASWDKALSASKGYDSHLIAEACQKATCSANSQDHCFERDGVVISSQEFAYPLMATLGKMALAHQPLRVLDFGGGLGSSYFQAQVFFKQSLPLLWHVVEQPSFANLGQKYFEGEQLKFFDSLETACQDFKPDLLLLSGVLQCLDSPLDWLDKFSQLPIQNWFIDRLPLTSLENHTVVVQHSAPGAFEASYPIWLFSEKLLKAKLESLGTLAQIFDALDNRVDTLKWQVFYQGLHLTLK